MILTGHWQYKERGKDYPDQLEERGRELARLHEKLLPEPAAGFDPDQRLVSCRPYQVFARKGEEKKLVISVTNPYAKAIQASVFLVLPEGVSVAGGKEFAYQHVESGGKDDEETNPLYDRKFPYRPGMVLGLG